MRHPETSEMSIIIIDEFTGRLMSAGSGPTACTRRSRPSTRATACKIKEETQTLATVTLQNFFKLYKKLARHDRHRHDRGERVLEDLQARRHRHPDQQAAHPHQPPDVVYRTEKEKWNAVVDEIVEVHKTGRPILIGTTDVDKSIKLSDMLKRRGIKHELLNAMPEHAAREAEIVAQAGRIGAVTIATNMAGRGTDIILGGNPETMAWAQLKDKYADAPRRARGRLEDDRRRDRAARRR